MPAKEAGSKARGLRESDPSRDWLSRRRRWIGLSILALSGLAAYSTSFQGPFVFDDLAAIPDNTTIRRLWPPWRSLLPPPGTSLEGRPIVNFSFALSYALSGQRPWGHHLANLLIHVAAAAFLFGVVRRLLTSASLRPRFGSGNGLALAAALLWVLHPLQTSSVTYMVQRAESLMGLFYLATLYCAIRSFEPRRSGRWRAAAVAACALGMGAKEVMASAPVMVLLYDSLLHSGSFGRALRRDPTLYASLASTWLLLGALMVTSPHTQSIGFGFEHLTWWDYLRTQSVVVLYYLRLAFWPSPLCFYYSWPAARTPQEWLLPAVVLSALAGLAVAAHRRFPALSFAGAWFFLILAPSSSFIPILTEVAAEHRMYLPLAAVVTVAVVGLHELLKFHRPRRGLGLRFGVVVAVLCCALGYLTWRRNLDFRDDVTLWTDTVRKQPENALALNNLGFAWQQRGDSERAIGYYREAARLRPAYFTPRMNLGYLLGIKGDIDGALAALREALRLRSNLPEAQYNLALALEKKGAADEALKHYREALRLHPDFADAHYNLAGVLEDRGDLQQAVQHYREVLRLQPENRAARTRLEAALVKAGENRRSR